MKFVEMPEYIQEKAALTLSEVIDSIRTPQEFPDDGDRYNKECVSAAKTIAESFKTLFSS